ncbi:hypothetical protein BU15DRAFT_78656 [Melanogaster broomeanus]|nr:hypothetical protein BU15DRAFT_78656 [Melanogaster broomeanus]
MVMANFPMHLPATTSNSTSHTTWDTLIHHHDHDYPSRPYGNTPAIPSAACTTQGAPSSKQSVEDILQTILRTRKSWKTLKGQAEAVWPPYLEATMLKALQDYEPDDSRETRMLGRYPMRNRFISDYVHRTTGKYRSAKQVGSRLQQLRDTAEGRECESYFSYAVYVRTSFIILFECAGSRPSANPVGSIFQPSIFDYILRHCVLGQLLHFLFFRHSRHSSISLHPYYAILVFIKTTPTGRCAYACLYRHPPRAPSLVVDPYGSSLPSHPPVPSSSSRSHGPSFRPSDAARRMRDIDPTVTFVSPSPVNGKSSYYVLLDGAPVHSEDTKLERRPVLYTTALVPKYWDILCKAADVVLDPTLYTIIQNVYRAPDPVPNQGYFQRPPPVLIFSAMYHFQYASPASNATSPMSAPKPGLAVTSALGDQVMQDFLNPIPFQKYSMYPPPMHEPLRSSSGMDQSLFDGPIMLDVNFDGFRFDDFIQDSPDSTPNTSSASFYPKTQNNFFM